MSSSSLEKASLRLPWGREEVIVAVEAIVVVVILLLLLLWFGLF